MNGETIATIFVLKTTMDRSAGPATLISIPIAP